MIVQSKMVKKKIDNAMSGIEIILDNIVKKSDLNKVLPLKLKKINKISHILNLIKTVFLEGHPKFALKLMEKLDVHSFDKKDIKKIMVFFQNSHFSSNSDLKKYLNSTLNSIPFEPSCNLIDIPDVQLMAHLICFIENLTLNLMDPHIKENFNFYILGESLRN